MTGGSGRWSVSSWWLRTPRRRSALIAMDGPSPPASNRAAWVAALVYLTTPWVYRLAVIPYVEGPLCYFHAALIWAVASDFGSRTQDSGLNTSVLRQGLPCRDRVDGRCRS